MPAVPGKQTPAATMARFAKGQQQTFEVPWQSEHDTVKFALLALVEVP